MCRVDYVHVQFAYLVGAAECGVARLAFRDAQTRLLRLEARALLGVGGRARGLHGGQVLQLLLQLELLQRRLVLLRLQTRQRRRLRLARCAHAARTRTLLSCRLLLTCMNCELCEQVLTECLASLLIVLCSPVR